MTIEEMKERLKQNFYESYYLYYEFDDTVPLLTEGYGTEDLSVWKKQETRELQTV